MEIAVLAETALLTHGLAFIRDEELLAQFPRDFDGLVWMEHGEIRRGNITAYLPFRKKAHEVKRIDGSMLAQARQEGTSAALTASAAMAVAAQWGVPLVVTAGMGGIQDTAGHRMSYDLVALASLPVSLLATAPKDLFHLAGTVHWLREHGVTILGHGTDCCDGFLFLQDPVPLDGRYTGTVPAQGSLLVLNPLPRALRFREEEILRRAVARGETARQAGGLFHPAVNQALDALTQGRSGQLQLHSFIENIKLALAARIEPGGADFLRRRKTNAGRASPNSCE